MGTTRGRLSGLDSSFLTVESGSAHMHVGWAALFSWPRGGSAPGFDRLRAHVAARLDRAPRCRQRIAAVPLGLEAPVWVDDVDFEIDHHVRRLPGRDFRAAVDEVLSQPLDRGRPLWELWIADELEGGRIGVVGKAHHAMVDGIAAIELAMLLVDVEPEPAPAVPADWTPAATPGEAELLAGVLGAQATRALGATRAGVRAGRAALGLARDPRRVGELATRAGNGLRAIGHAAAPAQQIDALAGEASPERTLAGARRPLSDLQAVRSALGGTVNDVVLAAVAGGLRRFTAEAGEVPRPKAMVPVNVRGDGDSAQMGNRIAFLFLELPCDEPTAIGRLEAVKQAMRARKRAGEHEAADAILGALEQSPRPLQFLAARALAGPRAFNLVVSNIPGPPQPLYMLGCPLEEVYPVVPIAEGQALSIGFTTVQGDGCFGVHADRGALPDAARLARDIAIALDELVAVAQRVVGRAPARSRRFVPAADRRTQAAEPAGPDDGAEHAEAAEVAAELDAAAAGLAPRREPAGVA